MSKLSFSMEADEVDEQATRGVGRASKQRRLRQTDDGGGRGGRPGRKAGKQCCCSASSLAS